MGIKEIKTEAENEAALDRVAELWLCAAGSPEEVELMELVNLIVSFEESYYIWESTIVCPNCKCNIDCLGHGVHDQLCPRN